MVKNIFFTILLLNGILHQNLSYSQDSISTKRLVYLSAGQAVMYGVSMTALYQVWYSQYSTDKFHFINDSKEWLQMDKLGHAYTGYYAATTNKKGFTWAGISPTKAAIISSAISLLYVSSLEVFDGFSDGWGASMADVGANFSGITLFLIQELLWKEQRLIPRFSFHTTKYPKYRPDLLGNGLLQQILKDYNGETFWLSVNFNSFFQKKILPDWLMFSFGYSADGMIGGNSNPKTNNGMIMPVFKRSREFLFSIDINLSKIKIQNRILKTFFNIAGMIKIPAPTILLRQNKAYIKPLYF